LADNFKIPARIGRLEELAYNLWWSWHNGARQVFRALDYPLWKFSNHNPVKQLREVRPETLQAAAEDPGFLELYDSVMAAFDADLSPTDHTWFATKYPGLLSGPVAYFSMEYAIHNSLPIYAGGLGVLAGDICKQTSDLGIPLVAVGFMYPKGYFHQHILEDGWQEELYQVISFKEAPVSRVFSPKGDIIMVNVKLADVNLAVAAWQVRVGRTSIYLLDTDLEENPSQYRELSAQLYIADRELRLQQEIVLGIGGVRMLRALGISPSIWHANEGHTAFMMLERVREKVAEGASFEEAAQDVQQTSVFTTHTPVMAGHDIFSAALMEKHFADYWPQLKIDRESFLQLGQYHEGYPGDFNMTAFCLRMASQRSAVSRLHQKVTQKMWHGLWPDVLEEQVPISYVTNGVHVPTWIAPELSSLLEKYLGKDWIEKHDDAHLWERLEEIPDEALWAIFQRLRRKLVGAIRERMRSRWVEDEVSWTQMLAMGSLLDPEVLTIAFARRFTEYKRPALLFRDVERLKRMVTNPWHPVQIIFTGKSHPADLHSKQLLQQVYIKAAEPEFQGRIVFIEDYDMHMARYLVQGVDVWLNVPKRLQEACGSSGMKAALNGVLHLSIPDGWWHEGFNGHNGWAIGTDKLYNSAEEEDDADAEALCRLLEEEIIPLYYRRDVGGVPREWIRVIKESMRTLIPVFCARRMMKEYTDKIYLKAACH